MKIPWKFIITHVIALRVITIIAALIGLRLLPFKASFPYSEVVLMPLGSPLYWSWANFDGVHYLRLAQDGYIYGLTQAYFPLYFLLIRYIASIIGSFMFSSLLISHLAFILGLGMFYRLIRLDYDNAIAKRALLFLIYFPTSFYFLSTYTESLFFLLIITTFYLIRTQQWVRAAVTGIFVTATRITGIFIIPALIYELWNLYKTKKLHIKNLVYGIIPATGLGSYMVFLWKKFGDPFLFAHVQEGFGAGRQTDKFVLLYQVFWRYIKMIFTVNTHDWLYLTIWLELLITILFISLLIYAYVKKVRVSYLIYAFLALILPTLTGTLSSMPRYVLLLFPGFMVLGFIKQKRLRIAILAGSIALLVICTMLFTRGYWIA